MMKNNILHQTSKYELLFWKMVARNKKIKMESEQKM